MDIRREDPGSQTAAGLMHALAREEADRYRDLGDDPGNGFDADLAREPQGAFLVVWRNGEAVGCGAFCPMAGESEVAEVRRMYVVPKARRLGIARSLLTRLEDLAAGFGYRAMRLETGNRQPEAIQLYEGAGYRRSEPYGCHAGDPVSVCFVKHLG